MVDVENIIRSVLFRYPEYGTVVANLTFVSTKDVERAATDGKVVYYNEDFISKLPYGEQVFVFAHEIGHVAHEHVSRREERVPKKWNIATDAVLNANLIKDKFDAPDWIINRPEAKDYSAEEYYEKILDEDDNNFDETSDHSLWNFEPSNENNNESDENTTNHKNNRSKENSTGDNNNGTKENANSDDIKHIENNMINEKEFFERSRKQYRENLENYKKELFNQSMGNSNSIDRTVNIGSATNLISWQRQLKYNTKYNYDFTYRNAEIEYGIVRSRLEEIDNIETEILIDTSGSVSKELVRKFLRECKGILKVSKLRVGCFDDKFYGFSVIRNERDIDNMKIEGGGGTNFNVAVEAFSKNCDNKIIFTDGMALMPKTKSNIVWVVYGNRKIDPKGGKVIYISEKEYKNLCIANDDIKRTL